MDKRTLLGRQAMRGALDVRKRIQCAFDVPICAHDVAERLGISVWFKGGGSFGGMYSKTANTILVPSLRPAGRQAFTCAHEIGHWYFGHGSKLDAYTQGNACNVSDEEELLADLFAGHLLMPSGAVSRAFKSRGVKPDTATFLDFYKISCQLGVGYTTLLSHMYWTQKTISRQKYDSLTKHTPKSIRADILKKFETDPGHLIIADKFWYLVPIDLQVGQVALLPHGTILPEGEQLACHEASEGLVVQAPAPGIYIAKNDNNWETFIRVSRKEFEGRCIYRHLEEIEDE